MLLTYNQSAILIMKLSANARYTQLTCTSSQLVHLFIYSIYAYLFISQDKIEYMFEYLTHSNLIFSTIMFGVSSMFNIRYLNKHSLTKVSNCSPVILSADNVMKLLSIMLTSNQMIWRCLKSECVLHILFIHQNDRLFI